LAFVVIAGLAVAMSECYHTRHKSTNRGARALGGDVGL
jgi:hypothetical protein